VGVGLTGSVARALRGKQCGALGRRVFVAQSSPFEKVGESPGELPGVCTETGAGGGLDRGEQPGLLRVEPVPRVLRGGELDDRHAGLGRCEDDRVPVRVAHRSGGVRGVEVVVERPVHRGMPVGLRIAGPDCSVA